MWEDSPQAMLLRTLFPRSVPDIILHDAATGRLHRAAKSSVKLDSRQHPRPAHAGALQLVRG